MVLKWCRISSIHSRAQSHVSIGSSDDPSPSPKVEELQARINASSRALSKCSESLEECFGSLAKQRRWLNAIRQVFGVQSLVRPVGFVSSRFSVFSALCLCFRGF